MSKDLLIETFKVAKLYKMLEEIEIEEYSKEKLLELVLMLSVLYN